MTRLSARSILRYWSLSFAAVLTGCIGVAQRPAPVNPPRPASAVVASIRAAGAREDSVIDVTPLRDPAVSALEESARADEHSGHFPDAAAKLDQALKLTPEAPDLLQDRAEIAVRLHDYPLAEKLARQSWSLGPKLGSLCARNWQTVVEMRLQAGDTSGAASARKWVQQCHKAGITRY